MSGPSPAPGTDAEPVERAHPGADADPVLALARHLATLSDDALARLLTLRPVAAREVRDVFDLAENLLTPESIRQALRTVRRAVIVELASGRLADDIGAPVAMALALATGPGPIAAPVRDTARALLTPAPVPPSDEAPDAATPISARHTPLADAPLPHHAPAADTPSPLAPAAERAFTAVTAVNELALQLRVAPARTRTQGGGLLTSEAKRLAPLLGVETEQVPLLAEAALALGVIAPAADEESLLSTARLDDWSNHPSASRWRELVGSWLAAQPLWVQGPLGDGPRLRSGADAQLALAEQYPAADEAMQTELRHADAVAQLLGASPEGPDAVELPEEVDRVYLQHDLTVVAPGPLRPALDARLRLAAELEQRGVASSYRISARSLDRALAAGETADGLRGFLTGLSLTGVPQALDYLLDEAARRHGLVRISPATDGRTRIRSTDEPLLRSIAVDQTLSPLALHTEADGTLRSRVDAATAFWLLADARYPVLAEAADGTTLVMRRAPILPAPPHDVGPPPPPVPTTATRQLVQRIRQAAADLGEAAGLPTDDAAWILRRLDRATRERTPVTLELRLPDGSTRRLDVTPLSLANGRLRCTDERAGVERTLPVSSITALEPA